MEKIVQNFKEIKVELKGAVPKQAISKENEEKIRKEDERLIQRKFYNGEVMGVTKYFIENEMLMMKCHKFNFFDIENNGLQRVCLYWKEKSCI